MQKKGLVVQFQEATKLTRQNALDVAPLDWKSRPKVYKDYPDAFRIELPVPIVPEMSLALALQERKSIREYKSGPLSLEELSFLLWAAGGVERVDKGFKFRTAPSAGALYPLETYLYVNDVTGLERGLYHYGVREHSLELLERGYFGKHLSQAALGDTKCNTAAVVFIWSAVFYRTQWKYQERALRYIYLDAGHLSENLLLAATALELGACPIAAFLDEEVNSLFSLDGEEESVIYLTTVGKKG